jgi:hypothetical protein
MKERIEVGCGWCGRWHPVKTLAAPLFCCKLSDGRVRCLILEAEDSRSGTRWFQITNGTEVKVFVRERKKRNGHGAPRAAQGRG